MSNWTAQELAAAVAVSLAVALWAVNGLIVVTIMPDAVREIGGVSLLSWASTAYMTAAIVASAVSDWVRDKVGFRTGFTSGGITFALGAAAAGLAPTMPILVAGRFVEGLGGGVLSGLAYGIIRAAIHRSRWTTIFAVISAVWGVSALIGPAVGGAFAETIGWRACFLTMAALATVLAVAAPVVLPATKTAAEDEATGGGRFPLTPIIVMALGVFAIAATADSGNAGAMLAMTAAGALLLAGSIRIDGRFGNPILPYGATSLTSPVGLGLAIKLLIVISTMPVAIFGPYVMQRALGVSPLAAGYVVALEAVGWTATSIVAARLSATRHRAAIVLGPAIILAGMVLMVVGLADRSVAVFAAGVLVSGGGYGTCWALLSGEIMGKARSGDGQRAAATVSTVEKFSTALGAALSGLAGAAMAFGATSTPELPSALALMLAIFALPTIVAQGLTVRLVASDRVRSWAIAEARTEP